MNKQQRIQAIEMVITKWVQRDGFDLRNLAKAIEESIGVNFDVIRQEVNNVYKTQGFQTEPFRIAKAISTNKEVITIKELSNGE